MKLKNKYGFTLIELLAVIVVLAIIALIATPIVMNTIKNAKKGAAERTADNYIKQVETAVAEAKLENKSVPNGTYDIDGNGNLTGAGLPDGKLEINMSGNKPTSGTVTIKNGGVSQNETTMVVGDYDVKYNQEKNKYEATGKGSTSSTTVVYRWSKDPISIGDIINPSDTSKFTKDASTLGKSSYLKHVLDKDNKVKESYACAVFNGKEYCVRGGKDNNGNSFYGYAENKADYTGNALILKQIEDAKIEGVSCGFIARSSDCYVGSVFLSADLNGHVDTGVGEGSCDVRDDGSSRCGG
jgi:type IV pilus assembly protein PilA